MSPDVSGRDGVLATVFGGAAAVVGDVILAGGDVILSLLVTLLLDVGSWFPILTLLSSHVAPAVPAIPQGTLQLVVAFAACLYVAVLLGRYIDNKL